MKSVMLKLMNIYKPRNLSRSSIMTRDQAGAASIIIVLFMSIILTVVTIGFLRIALNEQRISTDDDLSTRAFYAAESGIEDARRAIRENLVGTLTDAELNADNCDVPSVVRYSSILSDSGEFDAEYSCMLIDFTPNSLRSELSSANQSRQYEIKPINPSSGSAQIGEVILSWHVDAPAGTDGDGVVSIGGGPVDLRAGSDLSIPQTTNWDFPAMMRVEFINYPTANFGRSDINSSTSFVSPAVGGTGSSGNVFPGGNPNSAVNGRVLTADCVDTNNNDFACSMRFDMSGLPANRNLEVRISNLYSATTFEMTMESPAGDPLLFDEAQAIVDVTGRAGGVFRRVEAVLDLSDPDLLPDFAVQSAEDICKDFSFTDDIADFRGQLNSSCQF